MSEFVKGLKVKVQETMYGEIIKLGVNKEEFLQNPFNERGWLNIDILTSKEGKKYAKVNDYKATTDANSVVEETTEANSVVEDISEDDFEEDEIPF